MSVPCRECGERHETFRDGVRCDIQQYGVDRTRERLGLFCSKEQVEQLIADARRPPN